MEHTFSTEEEDGSLTWYDGLVVGHISETELFEVIYFGEDVICEFELLEDHGKGDLEFLSHV